LQLVLFLEIGRVRGNLFQINGKKAEPLVLPDGVGPTVALSDKVYVPVKEFPDVSQQQAR
jgi:protein quaking